MKYDKEKVIAFYAEIDDGVFHELIVDIYNRDYEYTSNCKEDDLLKARHNGVKQFQVSKELFYAWVDLVERHYSGCFGDAHDLVDEEQYELEESKKPLISKDEIWRAIRREIDEKEIDRIISFDYRYEKGDYYDFNLMIKMVHALMNGEQTISYFKGWCILLMRCFMDNMKYCGAKLSEVFYDLGDYFDAVAFMDSTLEGEEKLKECREIIAHLKWYNHRICDLKNKKQTDFTANGVITYISFGMCLNDGRQSLYTVCVVDKKRKSINYLFVPDIDYSEDINYTFLSQAEFEDLPNKYYKGYALDTAMAADYALKRRG